NSDIDLHDINVTATAHEPASNTSADAAPVEFNVIVDAVADKPDIVAQDVSVSDEGVPVNITINASLNDNDGSESITHYQIKGVPNGFTFNQGTDLGGGVWQFTPAEINGLKITPPNAHYEGTIDLEVHVFNYDDPTDKDFDTTNNNNSNCDTLTIEWEDDEPIAVKDNLGTAYDCAPGSSKYDAFYKGNLITGVGYHETLINGQPWNRGADATHSRKNINTGGKDILGKDAVLLTSFTFDGQTKTVPAGGSATIVGYNGKVTITLHSDGGYEVTSDRAGSYSFNYTITDSDGDCSSADVCFQTNVSPLVLDLDGDGVELINAQNGVMFDMNNDGETEKVGWAHSDDGLLAIDLNGDGIINNQSELFGNTDVYADGFANLAQYDQNGDGVIDALDGVFANLLVWQDANSDGFSDAGEMFSLSDLDITSISLSAAEVDYQINGNTVTDQGTFTYADGTTGTLVDAWFSTAAPEIEASEEGSEGGDDTTGTAAGNGQADTFVFEAGDNQSDIVQGFNADEGDVLDISALLGDDFDPLQDAINEFVFATAQDDGSTVLSVDATGSGSAETATQFATLQGVTTSIEELNNQGSFVTA
ncbi:MAG: type I secretion C-terminal target domain-containing protein, partial [Alphaproteobacteria bacterium]|nr:type I secretion C-terminal target domain-containing protein [Alphaproteobacteria bacterium]